MKKTFLITILVAIALLISIPQVFALELKVSQDGSVYFYEDSVLGDDGHENEDEDEYESDDDDDDHDDDDDDDDDDDEDDDDDDDKELIRTTRSGGNSIRVKTDREHLRVDFVNKFQTSGSRATGFDQMESSKVDRLKMEIPAGQTERQQKILEDMRETRKTEREEIRETYKDYLEQLREERKERLKEKIELRNQQREDGRQEIEFKSRGVSARLKNAEFEYDSETGMITLTTPSGNVHELNHLPDQAIERMMALSETDLEDAEVEVETSEDGSVEYTAKGSRKAKLFGLFSRNIETEVTLDDETGEVEEVEAPARSILGRILNNLSF